MPCTPKALSPLAMGRKVPLCGCGRKLRICAIIDGTFALGQIFMKEIRARL
jgi:hypothetical protein